MSDNEATNGTQLATVEPAPLPDRSESEQVEAMVTEAKLTTVRAQLLRAQSDELAAAVNIARSLTKSTSINPEFQVAHIPRGAREPLGDQAIYNLAVAIVYGSKLGWTPEEAAMRVFSVHGKPSIEAKDALGFIQGFIDRRIADGTSPPSDQGGDDIWEDSADQTKVIWYSRRRGREVSVEWSMERARVAGYTSNPKYQSNSIEMLRWKCVMELARMQWSDVLRGVQYSREELQLEDTIRVEHRPVKKAVEASAKGTDGLRQIAASRAAMTAAPAQSPADAPKVVDGEPEPHDGPTEGEPATAPGDPDDESPATPEQITKVKTQYKDAKVSAKDMVNDLSQFCQRRIDAVTELTFGEARDVLKQEQGQAEQPTLA